MSNITAYVKVWTYSGKIWVSDPITGLTESEYELISSQVRKAFSTRDLQIPFEGKKVMMNMAFVEAITVWRV